MNKKLKIIPSPQYVKFSDGVKLDINRVWVDDDCGCVTEYALRILSKKSGFVFSAKDDSDLIVTTHPELYFNGEDIKTFENKYADEQGYVLKKENNGAIVIGAKTDVGCAYGIITLSHILSENISEITVRDWPDFYARGNKWNIWAECGIWSYDFGDGLEGYKKRIVRKLDMYLSYKINVVNADGFGFDTERFEGYSEVMRFICDEARKRGIRIGTGGYAMGYGMVAHNNSYQGKGFKNRKSYPDGETYECMGTYHAWGWVPDSPMYKTRRFTPAVRDRSKKLTDVTGREWGTCLSNEELFEEKMKELENYVRKTHIGIIFLHNMDADEIHPELWMARCDDCRRKWPNDDIFAKDGCAGAFAGFITKLVTRLQTVKDGDYDASRDLFVRMVSPGYAYPVITSDEDYDRCVKFWGKVSEYLPGIKNFFIGFREQYYYHNKPVPRATKIAECVKSVKTAVCNFCGCDGFYDDKLFSPTPALNYILKGFDMCLTQTGNAFQEPMAVYCAEYAWNADNSSFYNVSPKPSNFEEYLEAFYDMREINYRPEEVYGNGGFLDIICESLYGKKVGRLVSEVYKLRGENGEPPIPCASNVDIYTQYSKLIYPMRWDNNEIKPDEIESMKVRFRECSKVSCEAFRIMKNVIELYDGGTEEKNDLIWLCECFEMGSHLTKLLYKYMCIYEELHGLIEKKKDAMHIADNIDKLRKEIGYYLEWVEASPRKPFDKFGGSLLRRYEIGEHLDYWTKIMLSSIKTGKRIPDDVRPLATRNWW